MWIWEKWIPAGERGGKRNRARLPGDIFKFLIENINKTFLRFFHAVMTLNVGVGNVVFLVLVLSTVRDMDYFRGKEGKMVSCKGKEVKVE